MPSYHHQEARRRMRDFLIFEIKVDLFRPKTSAAPPYPATPSRSSSAPSRYACAPYLRGYEGRLLPTKNFWHVNDQGFTLAQDHGVLDRISQFPNVARPGIRLQGFHAAGRLTKRDELSARSVSNLNRSSNSPRKVSVDSCIGQHFG